MLDKCLSNNQNIYYAENIIIYKIPIYLKFFSALKDKIG